MTDEPEGYYLVGKKHPKRTSLGEIDFDWGLKVDG